MIEGIDSPAVQAFNSKYSNAEHSQFTAILEAFSTDLPKAKLLAACLTGDGKLRFKQYAADRKQLMVVLEAMEAQIDAQRAQNSAELDRLDARKAKLLANIEEREREKEEIFNHYAHQTAKQLDDVEAPRTYTTYTYNNHKNKAYVSDDEDDGKVIKHKKCIIS